MKQIAGAQNTLGLWWLFLDGGTHSVRDAKVKFEQDATRSADSDVKVVPLANLATKYRPADRWCILPEVNGQAAPQGEL